MPRVDLHTPYITEDIPGIGGKIRAKPEDFIVEEVALSKPSGVGKHLYVNLTKTMVTTRDVQKRLARLFDVKYQEIGVGGLKDKESIATQTFSVYLADRPDTMTAASLIEDQTDLVVNWAEYHDSKFRSGYISGNRFKITISDISLKETKLVIRLEAITERIHRYGVPNYYGEQRLGRRGKNVLTGWRILNGEKQIGNKWLRRYLVSAYQSYICNIYLSERVLRGNYRQLLKGDIVSGHDALNRYWVAEARVDDKRYKNKEISFTAPMYGPEMIRAQGKSSLLEDEIFQASGLTMDLLRGNGVRGARRHGRMVPDVKYRLVERGVELSFMLEKGGFATTLLREYMKTSSSG